MKGVFVTGTDTNIGKTLVCAWLAQNWAAAYWKPVQSGAVEGTDFDAVATLAPAAQVLKPAYVMQAPLSPHEAGKREGIRVELSSLVPPPVTDRPLVVEGAGGIMVPLNENALMIDLAERLKLPVLVVARTTLGTINHTLMTLEMLRRRSIPILGVVMNGMDNPANCQAIEHFGAVPVLAHIPPLFAVTTATIAALPAPAFEAPHVG